MHLSLASLELQGSVAVLMWQERMSFNDGLPELSSRSAKEVGSPFYVL